MKRAHIAAAAFIGLGALAAGCGSSSVSTTPAKTPATAPSHPPATQAGIGSTINLSDSSNGNKIAVTVVKVADPDSSTNQFETPSAGDRYVSIQYQIVNTGTTSYTDDPQLEITAKDAAGQNLQEAFVTSTTAGAQLSSSVNLTPGDKALGYITFDVPTGDKVAQTQYSPNLGVSSTTGQWQIGNGQPPQSSTPPQGQQSPQSPPSSGSNSPQGVVEAYFAAINSGDYAHAWSLGGKNIEHGGYNAFVQGFAGTSSDAVSILSVNGGTVTVQLTATQTDGSQKTFSGDYTVQNGEIVAADIH